MMSAPVNSAAPAPDGLSPAAEPPEGGRRFSWGGIVMGVPVFGWVIIFFAVPYVMLFLQSFWLPTAFGIDRVWTLANYREAFGASDLVGNIYLPTLWRSVRVGAMVTIFATALAFPLAYLLAFRIKTNRVRVMLYTLVVVPLWASYLLRAYAWKVILGQEGLLASVLDTLGIHGTFLNNLLYSEAAVVIAMTHLFTPFMILTIYAVLERLPSNLIEASRDLGVGSFATFRKVVLPLSIPGVIAGATFTMGLSSGDFVAPMLVGGESNQMIANQIYNQFGATNNWPLGSALAFLLLAVVAVLVWISTKAEQREEI